MKILQVGKYFALKGGVETITRSFVSALPKNYSVDVLCFSETNETQKKQLNNSTIWEAATIFKFLSSPLSFAFFRLFKKIRNNYDVILIHAPNPMAALALSMFNTKAKIMVQWHGDILNKGIFYSFFKSIEKKMLKRADMILVTSQIYLDHSAPLKNFKAKSKVLPLGINEENLANDVELYSSIKNNFNNKKIVFALGRYVYYKGFEYLIDAANYLSDEFIILIGGHGSYQKKYEQRIKDSKLEHKVFLVPENGNINWGSYYAACDIFCLPSYEKAESFGIVLIEAMAFSKPIVATKIPGSGTTWVNRDNYSGLNVDLKNSKQLATAINEIAFSKKYTDYCSNSRKRFENDFTESKMISTFVELVSKIL